MGAGGCIVPPPGYLRRCQQLCRANDIIFIADEVVTAFGRLGHYFASEAVQFNSILILFNSTLIRH